jgi:outer membrane biosynthesis protein TonB
MRKANGSIHTFIKLSLLIYVFLLFLFSNIGENMTYAMNSNLLLTPATIEPIPKPTAVPTLQPTTMPTSQPTAVPTPKPTAVPTSQPTVVPTPKPTTVPTSQPTAEPTPKSTVEPTPKSTPIPGQVAVQPRQTTPTPQTLPIDPSHVPSTPVATMISRAATPTSTLVTGTPTIVVSLPGRTMVLSALPIDSAQQDNNPLRLIFFLGIVAPSLLITAGTLWLTVNWLLNRRRLVSTAENNSD